MIRRIPLLIPVLLASVVVLGALSVMVGKVWLGWNVWLGELNLTQRAIFLELRLPRALLGIVVGAALGVSGAALQGYLRNPLADPGVVGVSAMAALGAVCSIFFGFAALTPWALPVTAVLGAMIGVGLLFGFAGVTASVMTFVLAGIILSAIASSLMTLLLSLAPNPWAAGEIIQWLMGALTDRSFDELNFAAPLILAGCGAVMMCRSSLDALTLGDSGARSLGVNLNRTQWQLATGVGLAVGASVAVTGVISFVGLVVPHLLRPLVGAKPGALLLPSALGGAALVLAGDILVRLIPAGTELKLGVAMSFIGAPFFLALLLAMRRKLA
jgi:iron complex transport system permease protein